MHNDGEFTAEVLEWYQKTLASFDGKKKIKSNTAADVICPGHDDTNPSLGVDLKENNGSGPRILIHCRAHNCDHEAILTGVGLTFKDLFFRNKEAPKKDPKKYGCTLEEYAKEKRLPIEFLEGEEVGLVDTKWFVPEAGEVSAVDIPYATSDGTYVLSRYRVSLDAKKKVVSKRGDPTMLYGLHRIQEALEAGYALLVEGESDCHTAWYRSIPALGIPGAGVWKDEWDDELDKIKKILVIVEPGGAGDELWKRLKRRKRLSERLERIDP
jgi:hypothetical protein